MSSSSSSAPERGRPPSPSGLRRSKRHKADKSVHQGPSISTVSESRKKEAASEKGKQKSVGSSRKSIQDSAQAEPERKKVTQEMLEAFLKSILDKIEASTQELKQVLTNKIESSQTSQQLLQEMNAKVEYHLTTIGLISSSGRAKEVGMLVIEGAFDISNFPGEDGQPQIWPAARSAYIAHTGIREERGRGYVDFVREALIMRKTLGQEFDLQEYKSKPGSSSKSVDSQTDTPPRFIGSFPALMRAQWSEEAREAIEKVSRTFQTIKTLRNKSAHTTNALEVHYIYHYGSFTEEVRIIVKAFWPFLFSDTLPLDKKILVCC